MNLPTMEILDPVGDRSEDGLAMVPRLRYLRGARLGVLDTQWRSFTTLLEKLLPPAARRIRAQRRSYANGP